MCNSMQPHIICMTLLDTMQFVEVPVKLIPCQKRLHFEKESHKIRQHTITVWIMVYPCAVWEHPHRVGYWSLWTRLPFAGSIASPQTGRLLMRIWRLLVKSSGFLKCTRSFIHRYSGAQLCLGPCMFICYFWQPVDQITSPFLATFKLECANTIGVMWSQLVRLWFTLFQPHFHFQTCW